MACGGGYKGQLREGEKSDVVLLILGGSLGASAINRAAARAIPELLATHENLWVVWQTGADGHERAVAAVAEKFAEKSNVRCTVDGRACKFPRLSVVPFIDEMDAAYGASDLVVARAGAITCAELVATATPAILVPSPNVAEDHQTKNANALAQFGCAAVLPEHELFVDGSRSRSGDTDPEGGASTLTRLVSDLLMDPEKMRAMAAAAAAADTPRAAEEIAEDIARVAAR
jgi:UDP-N-acetylglucosamine--N-acetylmuramyl-(pentapeptide) pyrophosphoryl-undecaprenol N-acetylglucosamine transferase